jgi:uncharacterized protein YjdB
MKSLHMLRVFSLALLTPLLNTGCSEGTAPDVFTSAEPAVLNIVQGADQSAPAGTEVPSPLVVQVLSDRGRAVPNQVVNFHVVAGGGRVWAGTALTDSRGIAQERWTLGPQAGLEQVVEARAVSTTSGDKIVFARFEAEATIPVRSISVSPGSQAVSVGQSVTLTPTARDSAGNELTGVRFAWESSAPAVAAVDSTGRVSALAAGSATISASAGGESGTATVSVNAVSGTPPSAPTTPQVTTAAATTDSFSVTVRWQRASGATQYEVASGANSGSSWTFSRTVPDTMVQFRAPIVAGVEDYWVCVYGLSSTGTRSEQPACNAYGPPTSSPTPGTIASITVSPASASMQPGGQLQLQATARDAAGTTLSGITYSWTTTNSGVATVNGSGLVSAVAAGSASIRATASGITGTSAITVESTTTTPPPTGSGVLFRSDWIQGPLGDSRSAITDNGLWPRTYCDFDYMIGLLSVVDNVRPANTRLTRSLRVQQRGDTQCRNVQVDGFVPRSTDWYARFYFRNDDTSGALDHIATIDTQGWQSLVFIERRASSTGWEWRMTTTGSTGYPVNRWVFSEASSNTVTPLALGRWYRMEFHIQYIDPVNNPSRFRVWPRLYDEAGNLIGDHRHMRQIDAGRASYEGRSDWTLASWYSSGRYFTFTNLDYARNFGIGNNGAAGATNTGRYWYFAGVELRSDTWPGPAN